MYKPVITLEEEMKFREIWTASAIESGWIDDPYYKESVRYFILHPSQKKVIGTIEFVPCSVIPQEKLKNRYHSNNYTNKSVWEIDRLTLIKGYRKKGNMKLVFRTIKHHYKNHSPDAYIGLMEKNFYISLQRFCGNDLKKTGPAWRNKNAALIPVFFPVREIARKKKYFYYVKIALYVFYLYYQKLRIKWTPGLKLRKIKKRVDMFFIKN